MLKSFKATKSSFNKRFFYIALTDLFSIFIILSVLNVFSVYFGKSLEGIHLPESPLDLSENEVTDLSDSLQSYYIQYISLIGGVAILSIIIYTLSRAIIWSIMQNENINLSYLLKSIPLGLVWFILGIIPFFLIYFTFAPSIIQISSIMYLLIFAYFTFLLFMLFAKEKKFVWLNAIKEGVNTYKLFLAFCILSIILYLLVSWLNILTGITLQITAIIIILAYLAWSRFFLLEIKKRG